MEQDSNSLIVTVLFLFAILNIAANTLIFWPDIIKGYYRNKLKRLRRKRLIALEEKLAALEKPPKATFFSRVNGKYITIEGPEEEQYLSNRKKRM